MDKNYYVLHLLPPRPDFAQTMSPEERTIMEQHVGYWMQKMQEGKVVIFGPVMDPREIYGLGIVSADNEEEVRDFIKNDPAATINSYEYFPIRAVLPAAK